MVAMSDRAGVLLVNTGSPSAPEPAAVKEYLSAYLMDPCIRPLPAPWWWLILHLFILPARKVRSAEKYRQIWMPEGSPLVVHARRLAERTAGALSEGEEAPAPVVRAAMSYGEPALADELEGLRRAGCEHVVVIPLYPQTAHSTNGSIRLALSRALEHMGWQPDLRFVDGYGEDPAYVDAIAGSLLDAGFDAAAGDHALFSFHAVPQPDVDAGDTYPRQTERSCELIASRLGLARDGWTISYHSPFEDNRRWHGPFTSATLPGLARRVTGRLFFICPGFSIDCLETLYDVQHDFVPLYREAAPAGAGMVYVPCLNDAPVQARLMAALAERELAATA